MHEEESRLHTFIDDAPAAIAMFDRELRYLGASGGWKRDHGLTGRELIGVGHYEVFPALPERWKEAHGRALQGEVVRADADRFERADGSVQWLRWEVRPWREAQGAIGGIIIYSQDLSDLKNAEQAVRESEARLAAIVGTALDGIITADERGRLVVFNEAAANIFGWAQELALGMQLEELIPERFRGLHGGQMRDYGTSHDAPRRMGPGPRVVMALRRNGEEFPIATSISATKSAGGWLYTIILRDVTERLRAESELRRARAELREAARGAATAREEERRRISRELHDGVAQDLAALKLELAWLGAQLPPAQAELRKKLEALDARAAASLEATARIAGDLWPRLLDELGLLPALESLAEEFARRTGVPCALQLEPAAQEVAGPLATAIFHVAQEALSNVQKHAAASRVELELRTHGGELLLTVRDDGRGFAPGEARKPAAYGLAAIRERISVLEGSVRIESTPGRGTTLEARVSLPGPEGNRG